ncbi:MAG: hypothetical protein ACUBOA_03025 [Candidatus Loosdrechtia sp.]|uniref:hypothetical protein n=1 Tax=Candidatus Loosdrechtia sp. TaxID=3101272 RepID=UPI003A5EA815|nr:MAG: hypothetical protein QY305_13315 [Candidatus Jettenia sp. AMX2]
MITEVNEPVKVGAIFGDKKKKLRPVWFVWSNQEYRIREITYIWKERAGEAVVYYFTVTDNVNLFTISYNTETLIWTLHSIEMAG